MKLSKQGFTLIELIVVVAIVAFIVGAASPSIRLVLQQTGQQDTVVIYVQTLHRAQVLAQSGRGDSSWGVYIATSSIVLFKGLKYASRDGSYDEVFASSVPFTVSGLSEIAFSKFVGTTTTTGTTTIVATGAQPKYVNINGKGTITY